MHTLRQGLSCSTKGKVNNAMLQRALSQYQTESYLVCCMILKSGNLIVSTVCCSSSSQVVHEVSRGTVSEQTLQILRDCRRPLSQYDGQMHKLVGTNQEVDMENMDCICKLHSTLLTPYKKNDNS